MELKDRLEIFKNKGWKYDPETGNVYSHTGRLNNTILSNGYIHCAIGLGGRKNLISVRIKAHQLAWYLTYNEVPNMIDHINHIKSDNRIVNLRNVDNQKNQWNAKIKKGYFYDDRNKKFRSRIVVSKKTIHLGSFKTEQEAHEAYLNAKKIYHIIEN